MLINRLLDTIFSLENLGSYVNNIIQVLIALIWIYITRKSKSGHKSSLFITLFLLALSVLMLVLTLTTAAAFLAEYAFIFLGVGILQLTVHSDS